jgi:hypothetical protein
LQSGIAGIIIKIPYMAPKDLKNSEELKLPVDSDLPFNDNLHSAESEHESVELLNAVNEQESAGAEEASVAGITDSETENVNEPESSVEPDSEIQTVIEVEEAENEPTEILAEETEAQPEPELIPEPEPEAEPEVLPEAVPEFEPVPEKEIEMQAEPETAPATEVTDESVPDEKVDVPSEITVEPEEEFGEAPEAETVRSEPEVSQESAEAVVAESGTEVEEVVEVIEEEIHEETLEIPEIILEKEEDASENAPEIEELTVPVELEEVISLPEGEHLADDNYEDVHAHVDYLGLSQVELVNLLRQAIENEDTQHNPDAIIAVFYRKAREKNDELKAKFLEEGGKEEDFVAEEDPYSHDVKELLKKYKQQKFEQSKKLDAEKEINLQKKYEIIEEIKNLLNNEESINRTFQEFRDLQRKWYEIGQVPQAKMKDLWDTYHFHVENFYDYIKINKELRDLDLKKNLELKIELCEKTEELLMEPSVIKAFNALQKYHEEWREIGPVPSDKKDEIWERFKAATAQINQKHQDYFEKRKLEQKKNLDAKIALCEKAEEISAANFDSHREWDEKSRELVELQKVWKTIGFAPKRDNSRIYDRFRAACDKFFINKREYYSKNKDIQQTNLQMKIDLCLEAETLKESTDWKKATQQFIDIQKRWKEVGAIPRKSSDAVWKRFRAACDYFFERKAAHFSDIDGEQYENLKLKEKLIEEVEKFKADTDVATALKNLRDLQRRWTEIGHVPLKNKDVIQHRFREAINKQFDALKVDNSNRNVFNFRNKIESMTDNARGLSKVRSEREKYMLKLKQLETDLTLLDNNIGFFANSKNAQALIADVNQKIKDTREKIEQLKEKIRIIDDLDKSEY